MGGPLFEEDGVYVYALNVINEIEYRFFLNHAKQWCIRVKDLDAGEVVGGIRQYPQSMLDKAEEDYSCMVDMARRTA